MLNRSTPDGTVNQENLRLAKAADTYLLNGEGVEVWEPRFYLSWFPLHPGGRSILAFLSCLQHFADTVKQPGTFHCSNDLLNRIHLVQRTETSNLHSIPTVPRTAMSAWVG